MRTERVTALLLALCLCDSAGAQATTNDAIGLRQLNDAVRILPGGGLSTDLTLGRLKQVSPDVPPVSG